MIPKIIHFCWLSGDPYPEDIKSCMATWYELMPDYEFMLWDLNRFDVNNLEWTKQAFEHKKYAFAADFIRFYSLSIYGGIYLDTDVKVFKSFNGLLDLPYFIGRDYTNGFEAAVIGAEPGNRWINEMLKYYSNREFVSKDGLFDTLPLPLIMINHLKHKYEFNLIVSIDSFNHDQQVLNIFEKDYFNGRDQVGEVITKNTFSYHKYAGAWTKKTNNILLDIFLLFPDNLKRFLFKIRGTTNWGLIK